MKLLRILIPYQNCANTADEDQPSAVPDQPGWVGATPGDITMGDQPAPYWQQPPTEGWVGADGGNMGFNSDNFGGQPEVGYQPPFGGQPGGFGANSNNHM